MKKDKPARALLSMRMPKEAGPPKIPSKADLGRRFVLRTDSKGKPILIEK